MTSDTEFKALVRRVEELEKIVSLKGTHSLLKGARGAAKINYPSVPASFLNKVQIKKFPSGHSVVLALVMFFAKGDVGKGVDQKTFESAWKKLNRVIGIEYNPIYLARARDKGWVDGPGKKKNGLIVLLEDGPVEFSSILEKITEK